MLNITCRGSCYNDLEAQASSNCQSTEGARNSALVKKQNRARAACSTLEKLSQHRIRTGFCIAEHLIKKASCSTLENLKKPSLDYSYSVNSVSNELLVIASPSNFNL